MNPENFAYWLQGFFEILAADGGPDVELTVEQVACVKDHLALALTKVTPERGERNNERADDPQLGSLPSLLDKFLLCDKFSKPDAGIVVQPTMPNQVEPKTGVEYWKGRPIKATCTWNGDGRGRKYC